MRSPSALHPAFMARTVSRTNGERIINSLILACSGHYRSVAEVSSTSEIRYNVCAI